MKKRALALALCLLLAACLLSSPRVEAADSLYFTADNEILRINNEPSVVRYLYFTAAGNEILPLDESTMPFWSGGYLYVASSIFTGQVNKSLGVACLPSESMTSLCILYAGSRSLLFDLKGGFVRDSDGNVTFLGAIRRGGEVFVPASVVAEFFRLEYSVTPLAVTSGEEASYGALVWLRQPNFGLSEKDFINAASSQIAMRYAQYLQNRTPEESGGAGETPEGPQMPEGEGKSVYLCLEAGEGAASLLDALAAYDAQAAFFCGPDFLEDQGDLLRRMTATGQTIGLLADAGDAERTVAEQLEAGNALLARATMGKTRLVRIRGGGEQELRAAREAGYVCLESDLDSSGAELLEGAQADALLRQVSALRGDVRLWLGSAADSTGLRAFLTAAVQAEDRCLALTETTAGQR